MTSNPASDTDLRRRRLLGVGLAAGLVSAKDVARDVSLVTTPGGVDLALVAGIDNLCQDLAMSLTTLRGSDVFNQGFGFLGLGALTEQTSPVLAREGVRSAVAECVAADPRVRRIVDLQVDNPMATPPGNRALAVQVAFETVTGDSQSVVSEGLATGGDWGTVESQGDQT